jgi:hypothetical protein
MRLGATGRARTVGALTLMREVNTAQDRLYGIIITEIDDFIGWDELAILLRYGAATKFTSCGFEKFLPADATIDERTGENSRSRRKVKGRIWANGVSSRLLRSLSGDLGASFCLDARAGRSRQRTRTRAGALPHVTSYRSRAQL